MSRPIVVGGINTIGRRVPKKEDGGAKGATRRGTLMSRTAASNPKDPLTNLPISNSEKIRQSVIPDFAKTKPKTGE